MEGSLKLKQMHSPLNLLPALAAAICLWAELPHGGSEESSH